MIYRIRKALFVAGIVVLSVLGLSTMSVSAAVQYTNSSGYVKLTCGSYSKKFTAKDNYNNFSAALQKALDKAGEIATDDVPAKITVAKGYYNLDRTLRIYSNTTLVATGSFFRYYGNHLRNGFDDGESQGYGYTSARNITVKGGTWDACETYSMAGSTNTDYHHSTFRFGHMTNLVIKNCTFKNNFNCHDLEIAGVDRARIVSNIFYNDHDVNTCFYDGGREALQIDSNTYDAMPFFGAYDKTPCKNIAIRYNSFRNKYRAIGSHHAVLGNPYENISVYNNEFDNIGGIAVYGVYWTNSKIYSNVMKNVGLGIDLRSMTTGSGLNFYNLNDLAYEDCESVSAASSTYIYGNTIRIRNENNTFNRRLGIRAMGDYYSADDAETGTKAGVYKLYNVHIGTTETGEVFGNRISGNAEAAIQLNYGVNSEIKGNVINVTASTSDGVSGIELKASEGSAVEKNRVVGAKLPSSRGILATFTGPNIGCKSCRVDSNTVKGFGTAGVFVNIGEDTSVENNTVDDCLSCGVVLRSSLSTGVHNNVIKNIAGFGLYAYNSSTGVTFDNNEVKSSQGGIKFISAYDVNILSNKLYNLKTYAVYVNGTSDGINIISNKIRNNENAIFFGGTKNITLEKNRLNGTTAVAVLLSATNRATITNNIIVSGSNAVRLIKGADNTEIYSNQFTTSDECVYLNGSADADTSVKRLLSVTDNILDSPAASAVLRAVYNNCNVTAYDNTRSDNANPLYRFKGTGQEAYTKVKLNYSLTKLTSDNSEGNITLKYSATSKYALYRIFNNSSGSSEFVCETDLKSYTEAGGSTYSYTVTPFLSVGDITYLGKSGTITESGIV